MITSTFDLLKNYYKKLIREDYYVVNKMNDLKIKNLTAIEKTETSFIAGGAHLKTIN